MHGRANLCWPQVRRLNSYITSHGIEAAHRGYGEVGGMGAILAKVGDIGRITGNIGKLRQVGSEPMSSGILTIRVTGSCFAPRGPY